MTNLPREQEAGHARTPYEPPALVWLGDIRELTLGASPGLGDSGGGTNFKCPGCP
jgi:hypothetical protein